MTDTTTTTASTASPDLNALDKALASSKTAWKGAAKALDAARRDWEDAQRDVGILPPRVQSTGEKMRVAQQARAKAIKDMQAKTAAVVAGATPAAAAAATSTPAVPAAPVPPPRTPWTLTDLPKLASTVISAAATDSEALKAYNDAQAAFTDASLSAKA